MITIISSGFLPACLTAATDGGGSRTRSCSAWAPLRPSATPNSTRCPCRSAVVPEGSADECTNTSPPSSRARKPYPLSESYHLTLPVGTRRPHVEEKITNSQRSCDRQDAMGISKAIGPGRRIAASLSPGLGDRCPPGPETQTARGESPGPSALVLCRESEVHVSAARGGGGLLLLRLLD